MNIDNVIISTNDAPEYIEFLPIVSKTWKKLAPSVELYCGYASDKEPPDEMHEHAKIVRFWHESVPSPNMAKVSRMLIATNLPGRSLLSDVDMLPLQAEYFDSMSKALTGDEVVFFNADVYTQDNRFPICYILASMETYREIVNPHELSTRDLLGSWVGVHLDHKDDVSKIPFSDESLLRWMLKRWNKPYRMRLLNRGWAGNIAHNRVDRAAWAVSPEALRDGLYIDAHMLRPLHLYKGHIKVLTDHLGIEL